MDAVPASLAWLDSWPVGLKLNTELSHGFRLCAVTLTYFWARETFQPNLTCLNDSCVPTELMLPLCRHLPLFINVIGLSGRWSLACTLSCLSDFLSLATVNLFVCYVATAAAVRFQLHTVYALFTLFRGESINAEATADSTTKAGGRISCAIASTTGVMAWTSLF